MSEKTRKTLIDAVFPRVWISIILVLIIVICQGVIMALLSKNIVEAITSKNYQRIIWLSIWLIADLGTYTLANVLYKRARFSLVRSATYRIENALLEHHKRIISWRIVASADVLGYMKDTSYQASGGAVEFLLDAGRTLIVIFSTSIYTILLNPIIFCIILIFVSLTILWMRRDTQRLPKLYEVFFEHNRVLNAKLWEQVKNHEAASLLNQTQVSKGYLNRNERFISDLLQIKKIDNKVFFAKRFGPLFLMVIVVLAGGYLQTKSFVTTSEIYAMVVMIPSLAGAMIEIPSLIANSKEVIAAKNTLDGYFDIQEAENTDVYSLESIERIDFRNISYSYPNSVDMALKKINLTLSQGLYCLAGPSGSGKSTMLLLLMRLIDRIEGEILINGRSILEYDRSQYFDAIGYMSQNPTILPGTIRWNIVLNQPYDEMRLKGVVKDAAMEEWVYGLEQALDTYIDADSTSSGERQKICMARLLYRKTRMLILDEATSAMDPVSEQQIISALCKRAKHDGVMVIYSTHNLKFMQAADHIFWFENGQIAMAGSFDEMNDALNLRNNEEVQSS